jgi:hypothetical protein
MRTHKIYICDTFSSCYYLVTVPEESDADELRRSGLNMSWRMVCEK